MTSVSRSRPAKRSRWDNLLEGSVVGSFTSFGYKVRSQAWDDVDTSSLAGKTALITGATSGIGRRVATELALSGARLRFVARNPRKAEDFRRELRDLSAGGDIEYYLADLSEIANVRRVAEEILSAEPALHLLINNAVVLPATRMVTPEGLEMAHATNLVAPFVLTNSLIPRLVESQPARIINVISGGMYAQGLALDDLNYEQGTYRGSVAYARAKRGLMVLTKMWGADLADSGVVVHATHPGWVDTPGVATSIPTFHRVMGPWLRTTEQGADTILWLAAADLPGTTTGKLWHDRAERPEYRLGVGAETATDREKLWSLLEQTVASVPTPACC